MLQTKGLIPALGEDVNGNLAPNGIFEVEVWKCRLKLFNQRSSDALFLWNGRWHLDAYLVNGLEFKSFLITSGSSSILNVTIPAVPSNGRDVDHSLSKLNKCSPC